MDVFFIAIWCGGIPTAWKRVGLWDAIFWPISLGAYLAEKATKGESDE